MRNLKYPIVFSSANSVIQLALVLKAAIEEYPKQGLTNVGCIFSFRARATAVNLVVQTVAVADASGRVPDFITQHRFLVPIQTT